MSPLFRLWAICAACVALLLALRGAWMPAALLFFLSPAPAWVFAHGRPEQARLSASWLRSITLGVAAIVALYVIAVAMGGLPPVHEWRAMLAGSVR
ncbi:hypothetical protein BURK1_00326 [Burkholderiales bacterium]|nr:hypothetical protein BURK1_00326 [Burkholderiales bacterium]